MPSLPIQGKILAGIVDTGLGAQHSVRLNLLYHTLHQVKWGLVIGLVLGVSHYVCTELLSAKFPDSMFGRIRFAIVNHPISVWLQLRDGWAVWEDGGREAEWKQWRTEWLKQHARLTGKKKT